MVNNEILEDKNSNVKVKQVTCFNVQKCMFSEKEIFVKMIQLGGFYKQQLCMVFVTVSGKLHGVQRINFRMKGYKLKFGFLSVS